MEELFKLVKEYGFKVRYNNLDGLESWKRIKSILQVKENKSCHWNITKKKLQHMYSHVYNDLNIKGEESDPGFQEEDPNHDNWEKNHFYLQLVRIPNSNECGLVRVCQIAYNLGQLKAERDDPIYTTEVKKYFKTNRLGALSTYIDIECFDKLYAEELKEILSSLKEILKEKGGKNKAYYKKYLKYKTKYLNISKKY